MNPDECRKANGTFEGIEPNLDNLKFEINQLLWEKLHSRTPLIEAERIAYEIYNLIVTNHDVYSDK